MPDDGQALIDFLQQRGHSPDEIDKIAKRLAEHDAQAMRRSIFDSIASGSFNLDDIIKEANPVKRGLCQKAGDWKWSSARFYVDNVTAMQRASRSRQASLVSSGLRR